MAKRGLHRSFRAVLRFSQPSSFVMTQELLISLPEAAMVRITPTGRQALEFRCGGKVPYIGFRICKAVTDGFTGINNTSASYSKKKIHIFSAAELNSLPDLGKPWIWNDASKSYIGNSCLVKYGSDFINKTGFNGTVSAVVDQNFLQCCSFRSVATLRCVSFPKTTRVG